MAPIPLSASILAPTTISDKVFELNGVLKLTGISVAPTRAAEGKATIVKCGTVYQCLLKWPESNCPVKKMKLSGNIKQCRQRKDQFTVILKNNFQIIGKECNPGQVKEFISLLDGIQSGNVKHSPVQKERGHDDEKENKPLCHNAFNENIALFNGLSNAIVSEKKTSQGQFFKTPSLSRASLVPTVGRVLLDAAQKKQDQGNLDTDGPTSPRNSASPLLTNSKDRTSKASNFYGSHSNIGLSTKDWLTRTYASPMKNRERISAFRGYSFRQRDKKPEAVDNSALVGFQNLGNTCYMNAILQTLMSLPTFANDLETRSVSPSAWPNSLQRSLCSLLNSIRKGDSQERQKSILKRIKQKISFAANRFSGSLQHDAHEFLCQCFDQIKEEASSGSSPEVVVNEKDATKNGDLTDADKKDDKPPEVILCPVKRNFECQVSHTIECASCKHKIVKEEIMHDFSLNIPDVDESGSRSSNNIKELLLDYFEEEKVEYNCKHCENNTSIVTHLFSKLPRIMTFHLKRYQYDTGISKNNKKLNKIDIPKFIDIGGLCTKETSLPLEFCPLPQQSSKQKRPLESCSDQYEFGSLAKIRRRINLGDFESDTDAETMKGEADESPSAVQSSKTRRTLSFESNVIPDFSERSEAMCQRYPNTDFCANTTKPKSTNFSCRREESLKEDDDCNDDFSGLAQPLFFDEPLRASQSKDIVNSNFDGNDGTRLISKDAESSFTLGQYADDMSLYHGSTDNDQPATQDEEDKQMQLAMEMSLIEYNSELEKREKQRTLAINPLPQTEKTRKTPQTDSPQRRYQLVGIINHIGDTTNVGHYTCDVYDHNEKEWKSCNDSSIKTVTEHEVRYGRVHSAYILFYTFEDLYTSTKF